MYCVYCRRPLCENFVTGILTTGDSDPRCEASVDWRHHLEKVTFTYYGNDADILRDAYQEIANLLKELSPGIPDHKAVRAVIAIGDDWIDAGHAGSLAEFTRNWWEANSEIYLR